MMGPVRRDSHVQSPAVPEVRDGNAAAVANKVAARRAADLLECTVASVPQMSIALLAMPRAVSEGSAVE